MDKTKEEVLKDLSSNEPMRIKSALHELNKRINEVKEFPLAPFGTEIFASFGELVPEVIQLEFLDVIQKYMSFEPQLSTADRISEYIKLLLSYAERYVASEIALKLKISKSPVDAITVALREIPRQGLQSEVNIKGASYLVSRLLDGKDNVRKATLEELRQWPKVKPYSKVKEYVSPQLNPDEVEYLDT